jgi:hypothetical protein
MGLKFRRGTTAQQSGSLAFGEPYVNTTLGTLVIGGATGDIVLSSTGTGSTGVFGVISGSALHITGDAQVGGNLTLGGQLTIGDNTSDVVNVVASLSSSLIPSNDNVFNIGSTSYRYANVYATTVSASAYTGLGNLTTYSTSVDSRLVAAESFSSSLDTTFATDASVTIVSASAFGAFTSASSYSASAATDLSASNAARVALSASVAASGFAVSSSVASATATSISTLSGSVKTVTDAIDTRVTTLEGKDISITLTGDVTGTGTITDLANVSFATTIAANSVALGTDTTGNYVASLVEGTGVTITNNSGEGATPTISIGQAVATTSAVTFASVAATGDIVAYSTSDKRHKNNIQLIPNALEKVSKLNGVTWEWNEDVEDVTKLSPKTGLIAQEVQVVLPEVVTEKENGFLGLDYSKMVGLLVEAIKEQQTQIHSLTLEIENLKKDNSL